MKKALAIAVIALLIAGPAWASEVSQGKCISYTQDTKTITMEEYDINIGKEAPYGKPTGIVSEFDCQKAKIGMVPEPGDILRISYDVKGDQKVALKVMNVSKQDLRKK